MTHPEATFTDGRSWIRKVWERTTYRPVIGTKEHFIARGVTRLSLVDRALVLFGRDIVTVVTSDAEPELSDKNTFKAIDTLDIEVGTAPRRYR